ncbi:hypothetical protein BJX63DRAFT_410369 [Aspergillus granulosus]|uniref:Secreted protein n=1 Tax=Aspergillus granulosus TaxID=176169 RepID=A0ABR4GZN7_9EURO
MPLYRSLAQMVVRMLPLVPSISCATSHVLCVRWVAYAHNSFPHDCDSCLLSVKMSVSFYLHRHVRKGLLRRCFELGHACPQGTESSLPRP